MNKGYFFALDVEASKLDDGLAIFNYTDLPSYIGLRENDYVSPQYPISVIITNRTIKFVLHYCIYQIQCGEGANRRYSFALKCPISPYTNLYSHKTELIHIEEDLIELPFSDDDKSLTSRIKQIYSTLFPMELQDRGLPYNGKMSANYMRYLLRCRYEETDSSGFPHGGHCTAREQYESFNNELDFLRKMDADRNCYSSLFVWGLKDNGASKNFQLYYEKKERNGRIIKFYDRFLRKLFLDFLFDLEHSSVFQNASYFDDLYNGLKKNYFCSAILSKSEFYYQKELVNANGGSGNHKIYAEYFDKAERNWVECIQDKRAEDHFVFIPDWYDDGSIEDSLCQRICQANNPKFRVLPASWFAEPEEEMQRVVFELEQINEKADETISNDNESICNSFIFAKKLGCLDQLDELKVREKKISQWMFRRYDFTDAFRLAYSSCLPNLSVFANLAIVAAMLMISILFIFFPSFIIGLFEDPGSAVVKFRGLSLFLTCFSIIPMYLIGAPILSLLKGICHKKIVFPHLHLFFPRLVASIAAAWLTVTFSEDLFKAFFDHHWNWQTLSLMGVVITAFVHYEVDKIIPHSTWWTKIMRSSELVLFSFVISLFVGVFAINFSGEKLLERCGILEEVLVENQETNHINVESINHFDAYSEQSIKDATSSEISSALIDMRLHENVGKTSPADVHHHPIASQLEIGNHYIFILWDFLIQFAFVAMFIGIFIQMIFEEKNITES